MSIFSGLVTDSQKIWDNIIVKGKMYVSIFPGFVTDIGKSQYYILLEAETMQIRQDVSVFSPFVTEIENFRYYIIVEGKDMCMSFPGIVTDSGKIVDSIILEEERLD